MRRPLLRSVAFVRAVKRLLLKRPDIMQDFQATLEQLSADAFHPKLKTHKLQGSMEGSWACSMGYDLRIIFEFVEYEDSEAILLETLGTHDQVY